MTSHPALYQRALKLLASRSHSRAELRRKLGRATPLQAVEDVLNDLELRGYLNDEAFAYDRALHRRRIRRWGNQRIIRDLKRLGIDARMIRLVLERLGREAAESDSLRELVRSRVAKSGPPTSISELKGLFDHCRRMGYAAGEVRRELEPYFATTAYEDIE